MVDSKVQNVCYVAEVCCNTVGHSTIQTNRIPCCVILHFSLGIYFSWETINKSSVNKVHTKKNSFSRKGFDRGRTQICNPRSDIWCLATRLHGRSRSGCFVQGWKNVLCCRQQLWCDRQFHGGQTLKTNGRLTPKPFVFKEYDNGMYSDA